MSATIDAENLSKYYGDFPAVTDISFSVNSGEILGLLGPNGAGKSTTMKMLTGFLPPSEGKITVAGYDIVANSLEARRHIGYLPETVPLYTDMEVTDYLRFMGKIRGMSPEYLSRRISEVIETVGLEEYQSTYIDKLSKGFKQRVGIAQAVLHEPDILILDEPTIGIDPIQVVETRQLIKGLGGKQTLILSSHILPEVSMVCERVIIIHEGQIVAEDTPDNLASRLSGIEQIEIDVRGPSKDIETTISGLEGVQQIERRYVESSALTTFTITTKPGMEVRSLLASTVIGGGWELLRLQSIGMTLEDIFLQVTTDDQAVSQPD